MNYQDLLNDERWKSKRQEILLRDKNTCQRCGINSKKNTPLKITTFENNDSQKIKFELVETKNFNCSLVKMRRNGKEIWAKTNIDFLDLDNLSNYHLVIHYVIKSFIKYPFNGSSIENLNENLFLDGKTNNLIIEKFRKETLSNSDNMDIDFESFWFIEKEQLLDFKKYNESIHVHHKCYRTNFKIWEQSNDEYVSLCNICHKNVHSNQLIPFYDNYGQIIKYLKPCYRCGGQKYFKQWKHIQNGICFRCNGKGFD